MKEWMQTNSTLALAAYDTCTTVAVKDPEAVTHKASTMGLATMSRTWYDGENNVSGYGGTLGVCVCVYVWSAPSVSTVRAVGNSADHPECLPYR